MARSSWVGLRGLTWRNLLIVIHDALATIFAVVASFYLGLRAVSLQIV